MGVPLLGGTTVSRCLSQKHEQPRLDISLFLRSCSALNISFNAGGGAAASNNSSSSTTSTSTPAFTSPSISTGLLLLIVPLLLCLLCLQLKCKKGRCFIAGWGIAATRSLSNATTWDFYLRLNSPESSSPQLETHQISAQMGFTRRKPVDQPSLYPTVCRPLQRTEALQLDVWVT